jgi:hypothetical protein
MPDDCDAWHIRRTMEVVWCTSFDELNRRVDAATVAIEAAISAALTLQRQRVLPPSAMDALRAASAEALLARAEIARGLIGRKRRDGDAAGR